MVQKDLNTIVSSMQPKDREYIRSLLENELISVHRTLGRQLRNKFRAGLYPDLFRFCSDQKTPKTRSFDSISAVAVRLLWEHLQKLSSEETDE